MSGYESGQNEHADQSPDGVHSTAKRRRIALACLECRRRKLKCDRTFPACTRCRKGGHSAECTYDPEAIESIAADESTERLQQNGQAYRSANRDLGNMASPASFVNHYALDADNSAISGLRAHVYRLENRIIGLEKAAHAPHPYLGYHPYVSNPLRRLNHHDPTAPGQEDMEAMMFRGKSFKTQFYGASHHTSYLTSLPKLREFMNQMVIQHPHLTHVQKELKGSKSKSVESFLLDKEGGSLYQLLPSTQTTDQLVHIYVENFEVTYRVLHLPSFFDEYHKCLDAPEKARPSFIALLLVMMAATNCAKSEGQSILRGDSSLERENAHYWIRATESWLLHQSHKHVSAITHQIRIVSFIAQQVNAIKRKRTYTSIGGLARIAISAGLHRDAEVINLRHGNVAKRRISLFDQEMRRRIWTTIAELELQTAIDRGMPATMQDLIIDCGAPLNIEDEKLKPAMEQPLNGLLPSEFSRSSFLHISYGNLSLRQEIVSLINGKAIDMTYEEMLQYDRRLTEALDDLPTWRDQGPKSQFSRTLSQLQLHYLQLLLHRPYVHENSQSKRYDYSAMIHLKSAMAILELHRNLVAKGTNVLCLMRGEILAAVYSICYSFASSGPASDQRLYSSSGIFGLPEKMPYLESALSMSENKIDRLGVGIQEYYSICAVIGLQQKQDFPTTSNPTHEFKAADRCSKMIKKMLSMQDTFSAAATLASLPNMPVIAANGMSGTNDTNGPSDPSNTLSPAADINNDGLLATFTGDLEGFEISGWDLDSFVNF